MARLKGLGRKKIRMMKIENRSNLEVTFSKRRSGVYRKASELSLLCDSRVAILMFSADDKIYSFGEPSAEQILSSFINENPEENCEVMENHTDHEFTDRNEEIIEHESTIEAEKALENASTEPQNDPRNESCLEKWWLTPIEELADAEAEELLSKLEEFKDIIDSCGTQTKASSSRHTNEVSFDVPGGGLPLSLETDLASTSQGFGHSNKGKAPMWE